ncbi:MAG: acyl-CoA desaturase [Spirochaetales bacterium]|nr:acyl-CoA desaturase [Spirochaetales bacterium]
MADNPFYGIKVKFNGDKKFQTELLHRVDQYFKDSGRSSKDNPLMYLKTCIILALFTGVYILLVFYAVHMWQAITLSMALGFVVAGIGFAIQHDASHNAYSRHMWINKIMAMTMDLIGGSSYIWKWKHVIFHHRYVNITGYDMDIDLGGMGRLSPHQKRRKFFRWQHFYLWILYGLLVLKWHMFDDFKSIITGKIGVHRIPRPKGRDLVILILGKLAFITIAFGIPLFFRPIIPVLFCYTIIVVEMGILMSIIFQLPHCVENSGFPLPEKESRSMKTAWANHQANVTLNFATRNPVLTWFSGGLNFHKEHHLFPTICHINYPALSKIVRKACRDFKIEYKEHSSGWAAIASHYRWLRIMGRKNPRKTATRQGSA